MLPEIRQHLIAPHAAVLFTRDLKQILWANEEGADLIGEAGKIDLKASAANASTLRQIALAVEKLADTEQANGTMRIRSGFQTKLLTFQVNKIKVTSRSTGVLLVTDRLTNKNLDADNIAESTLNAIDGATHSSVIFDETGAIRAASKNYSGLKLTDSLLANLAPELADVEGATLERPIKSKTQVFKGTASLLSADPILNLLTLEAPKKLVAPAKKKAPAKPRKTAAKKEPKKVETKRASLQPEQSPTAPPAQRIDAFYSKRAKPGESGPGKWFYQQDSSAAEQAAAKQTTNRGAKAAPPKPVILKKKTATPKPDAKTESEPEVPVKASAAKRPPVAKPISIERTRPNVSVSSKLNQKTAKPDPAKSEPPKDNDSEQPLANVEDKKAKQPTSGIRRRLSHKTTLNRPNKATPQAETVESKPAIAPISLVQDVEHSPIPTADKPDDNKGNKNEKKAFNFESSSRPIRFVWSTDANQTFTSVSNELADTVGESVSQLEGKSWKEVSAEYGVSQQEEISRLLSKGDTWSGKTVLWPIEGSDLLVPVDLAGLPTYDRDKIFDGFNGFGIIRTADAMVDNAADIGTETETKIPEKMKSATLVSRGKELSSDEESAFNTIGEKLSDKQQDEAEAEKSTLRDSTPPPVEAQVDVPSNETNDSAEQKVRTPDHDVDTSILSRLPIPVLVYRGQDLLFANSNFFDATGYSDLQDLAKAGGVDALFGAHVSTISSKDARIFDKAGETVAVVPNIQRVPWDEHRAMLLTLRKRDPGHGGPNDQPPHDPKGGGPKDDRPAPDSSGTAARPPQSGNLSVVVPSNPQASETTSSEDGDKQVVSENDDSTQPRLRVPAGIVNNVTPLRPLRRPAGSAFGELSTNDLRNILDTSSDGVVVLNEDGRVRALNKSAEALFDLHSDDVANQQFSELLAPESHKVLTEYFESIGGSGVASVLNDGREVIGKARHGGLIPMFMTMGKLADGKARCAVLRDITHWKKVEEDLLTARKDAEEASKQKSEFLAKVSHEIRTPLNAIIGFSDLMIGERLGPIENERYRGYVRDIKSSGNHVLTLVNDLLDITKIESGEIELDFGSCDLNRVVAESVALTQPQANTRRVIIRTSLSASVPPIVADERSLKQIILNLVTNSIKFTKAGGQVIVSTVYQNTGEVVLRVRDTGIGMTHDDLDKAMKPFTQLSNRQDVTGDGTGLGLPLTKAMVEANRATFNIESEPDSGTLAEVVFPTQRVLADQ